MKGPPALLLVSLVLLAGAPLRSGPKPVDAAMEVNAATDELETLVAGLEPPSGRAFTVRIPAFEDASGEIGELVAGELREAGLEVRVSRVQRGTMVTRLEVGRFGREDALRVADAISARFPVRAYVTQAP